MKVFTATLGTETNSFSAVPTGWMAFEKAMLWRPGQHPDFATEATGPLWIGRQLARERGWTVIEGTCAFAMPGGPVIDAVYETLRDEILEQIAQSTPLDMVALGLHGAMSAHGYPDCEGDFLERVRALVGDGVVVGAEIDPHAHLSHRMVEAADVIVAFKEYPHIDYLDRARDLYRILEALKAGQVSLSPAVFDCEMIAGFRTTVAPMRGLIDDMLQCERDGQAINCSLVQGFPLGDVADLGSKVLVYTDSDAPKARALAAQFGRRFQAAGLSAPRPVGPTLMADLSKARDEQNTPVVLSDGADNPGGGAAGDNMDLVRQMLALGMTPACAGPVWDPQAVQFCFEAGQGAVMPLRIGGKTGVESGSPFDAVVTVTGLAEGVEQVLDDARIPLGRVANVHTQGMDIVISELRDQCYGPELFRAVGVEPCERRYVLVKSSQQFRIGFESIAGAIVPIRRGIPLTDRTYLHRPRPLWPFEPLEIRSES